MQKILLLFYFVLTTTQALAQGVFISSNAEVSFYSYAPLEDITATSKSVNSMFNTRNNEIAFTIPMQSFKFEKSLMQEHFNEKYVESDKFPMATYTGKIVEQLDYSIDGTFNVTTSGELTIHGVGRNVVEKGTLIIKNDSIQLDAQFRIAVENYKIAIPKLLFRNIADTVDVKLKVNYIPFKKK